MTTLKALFRQIRHLFVQKKNPVLPYLIATEQENLFNILELRDQLGELWRSLDQSTEWSTIQEYQTFLEQLHRLDRTDIVPMKELMEPFKGENRRIALRYDIDDDPFTALRLARLNARFGISGTFYLLHTAPYYGLFINGIFHRNPELSDYVRHFIVTGSEIGLHTDPLGALERFGIDGCEAVVKEIQWLKNQGASICGTVAHNSYPAHGAENFEIFQRYCLQSRTVQLPNKTLCPLGQVNDTELGLTYEGNFPRPHDKATSEDRKWASWCPDGAIHNEEWMKSYLLDNPCYQRELSGLVWHHGNDRWSFAWSAGSEKRWFWKISLTELFAELNLLPNDTRLVFLFHPLYFSKSTSHSEAVLHSARLQPRAISGGDLEGYSATSALKANGCAWNSSQSQEEARNNAWIGVDFGPGQKAQVLQMRITWNGPMVTPQRITVQWSEDGDQWQEAAQWTMTLSNQKETFSLPGDVGKHRYWRIAPLNAPKSYFGIQLMELAIR